MPVIVIVIIVVAVLGLGTAIIAPAIVSDPEPPTPTAPTEVRAPADLGPSAVTGSEAEEQPYFIDDEPTQIDEIAEPQVEEENPYLQYTDEEWTPDPEPVDTSRSGGALGGLERF